MIEQFDMDWLRKISPTYEERFWKLVQRKHSHKRYGKNCSIDLKKEFRTCGCGKKITGETRYCTNCLRKRGFYQQEHIQRGRLAERAAIPDRVYYPRYEVAT